MPGIFSMNEFYRMVLLVDLLQNWATQPKNLPSLIINYWCAPSRLSISDLLAQLPHAVNANWWMWTGRAIRLRIAMLIPTQPCVHAQHSRDTHRVLGSSGYDCKNKLSANCKLVSAFGVWCTTMCVIFSERNFFTRACDYSFRISCYPNTLSETGFDPSSELRKGRPVTWRVMSINCWGKCHQRASGISGVKVLTC